MFGSKSIRFNCFFLDHCYFSISATFYRCRQCMKKMSNSEGQINNKGDNATENVDITFDASQGANFRRAWSTENIHDTRTAVFNPWWTDVPHFHVDRSWAYNDFLYRNGYQQFNGIDFASPVQYYPTDNFSGGGMNPSQSNPFYNLLPVHLWTSYAAIHNRHLQNMQRRHYIRRNRSMDSLPKQGNDNSSVLKVLSKRYWEDVAKKKKRSKPGFEFTIMSYNVLAQNLITEHPYLYKHHNSKALQWEKRWNNLFEEISKMQPDIMCLQEVQESHLANYYAQLETLGYKGIYKKRTGIRCDGCAIYYKANALNLVEYETVEFYQPNVPVLNRDNVAVIAKFNPKCNPQSEFVVATTHLLYNPKRQDVRLAQTQLLLTEVERLSFTQKFGAKRPYLPIIITGDFNTAPNSAVYDFITKGCLKYSHLSARALNESKSTPHGNVLVPSNLEITDKCQHAGLLKKRRKNESISRREEAALIKLHNKDKSVAQVTSETVENPELFCSGTISHLFAFKSVYNHGDADNTEGTTFQDLWLTVDYIFYSGEKRCEGIKDDKLKLISRYRLPRKNELGSMKIPNDLIGSDHLSLIAKFKLKI